MRTITIAGWLAVTGWFDGVTERFRADDRGAVTTETAVVTFVLVGGAIVVVGIIVSAATDWANNIPGPGGG